MNYVCCLMSQLKVLYCRVCIFCMKTIKTLYIRVVPSANSHCHDVICPAAPQRLVIFETQVIGSKQLGCITGLALTKLHSLHVNHKHSPKLVLSHHGKELV